VIARGTRVAIVCALLVMSACGKRGNPLPPLRPVPARVADLAARRVDTRVELSFTIPSTNADGSTPVVIDRVEIYATPVLSGVPAKALPQILADATNLRATIRVRPPAVDVAAPRSTGSTTPAAGTTSAPTQAQASLPAPGERTSIVDNLSAPGATATAMNYVAVGIAGGGRGRKGTPSGIVSVSLAAPPRPPTALTVTHNEQTVTVTWPKVTGQQVLVFDASKTTTASASSKPLTPTPVLTGTFTEPVQFGRERCFVARSVSVTGTATVEGPPSAEACITAVDRYPPPAPTSFQAIQEGTAVTLRWTRVEAADLAGYIVLRGDETGENMRPLMRQPVTDVTFSDTQVSPGTTYLYSVYAVDNAPIPNVSQQSSRQRVTVLR